MKKQADYHFVNLYHPQRLKWTVALLVLIIPFFINDFYFFYFENNPALVALLDNIQRVLILFFCYVLFGRSGLRLSSSLAPKEKRDKILDCFVFPLLIAIVFVIFNFTFIFFSPTEWIEGFRFTRISNPFYRWLDLTLGLALVAISEELIFRRHVYSYFASLIKIDFIANIIQAVLFGLMHWGSGVSSVICGFVFGLIAGVFYDQKKYLLPVIILHFLVNFIIYTK
jgi:membrane protease YdiL (CAAX protease family)